MYLLTHAYTRNAAEATHTLHASKADALIYEHANILKAQASGSWCATKYFDSYGEREPYDDPQCADSIVAILGHKGVWHKSPDIVYTLKEIELETP